MSWSSAIEARGLKWYSDVEDEYEGGGELGSHDITLVEVKMRVERQRFFRELDVTIDARKGLVSVIRMFCDFGI